jgi:hypothetical protein
VRWHQTREPQMQPNQLLVRRHGRLAQSIVLHSGRVQGHLLDDKGQGSPQDFQRLLGGKAARQVEKVQLIGNPQAVVWTATGGNLGPVGGGKLDAFGDECTRIMPQV